MRVCLTVQGEQPIKSATCRMSKGRPKGGAGGPRMAPGWPTNGPGWGGQCPGQCCPGEKAEKGRKCLGLRAGADRGFGEDDACELVVMVVSV